MPVSFDPATGTFSGGAATTVAPTKGAAATAAAAASKAPVYFDPGTGKFSNTAPTKTAPASPPPAAPPVALPAAPTNSNPAVPQPAAANVLQQTGTLQGGQAVPQIPQTDTVAAQKPFIGPVLPQHVPQYSQAPITPVSKPVSDQAPLLGAQEAQPSDSPQSPKTIDAYIHDNRGTIPVTGVDKTTAPKAPALPYLAFNVDTNDPNVQAAFQKIHDEVETIKKNLYPGATPAAAGFFATFEQSTIAGKVLNMGNGTSPYKNLVADDYSVSHPVASVVAKGLGTVVDTVMLSELGAGFNIAAKTSAAAGGLGDLAPTATRVIGQGLQSGTIFGIQSGVSEALDQAQKKQFDLGKIAEKSGEGFAFGAATGGAAATSSYLRQIAYAGAGVAGLNTIEKYVQNGKITGKDLVDIGVNSTVAMIFQAFNGVGTAEKFKADDMTKLAYNKEVTDMMGSSGASRAEAEQMVNLIRTLTAVRMSGQPVDEGTFKDIMSKVAAQRLPFKEGNTVLMQILQEIPDSFKSLPADEQARIADNVSEKVKQGEPVIQAIREETSMLPGAGISKGFIPPTGTPLEQMAAASNGQIKPSGSSVQQPQAAPTPLEQLLAGKTPQQSGFQATSAPTGVAALSAPATPTAPQTQPLSPINQKNLDVIKNVPAQAEGTTRVYHTSLNDKIGAGSYVDTNVNEHIGRGLPTENKFVADIPNKVLPQYLEHVDQARSEQGIYKVSKTIPSNYHVFNGATASSQPGAAMTLNAEIVPGLSKFITEDIKPAASGFSQGVKETFKGIVKLVNPVSLVPMKAMDIVSKNIGASEQQLFRTERAMKGIEKMWDKQPKAATSDFMARMEAGDYKNIPEQFRELAKMYRQRADNLYKAISEFKDVNFIQNWFPHIWKKVDKVTAWLGKRPLEGNKNFLHQRIFQTIAEGEKAGFELLSNNPEILMQMAEASVARFVMANRIRVEEKKIGMFRYVKFNQAAPEGFARINDKVADVYLPKNEEGGYAKVGHYYAEEGLARIINNYLSRDFLRETAAGRGLLKVKNFMNAFQLGISAFHATFEALVSVMTAQDVALSKLARGNILGAAKDLITSPIAPALYFNDGRKFYNGSPELLKIENDLFSGGAKLRKSLEYRGSVVDNFLRNVRSGNYVGAAIRLPLAAIEASLRPLFTYIIPRIKVGAFRALFSEEITRLNDKIVSGEITREQVARDVWANIENRFGLLNYDRLFWNNTFKTAMFMTFRAVAWNYGTGAELGGAVKDVVAGAGKTGKAILTLKKNPDGSWAAKNAFDFTPKIRFALSLLFTTMVAGAVYQYLHTGQMPQSLLDYFYPKDNQGRRRQFPTYMKDIYGFITDPKQTVWNKTAPELATMIELMQNRNYFGDMIYNPDDAAPEKLKQMVSFVFSNSFIPFSISNQQQLSKKGGITTGERIESFLGINNAPAALNKTQAQLDLQKKERLLYGAFAPRTPEQVQIDNLKAQAKIDIANGDLTTFNQLKKMGAFKTAKEAAYFLLDAKQNPAVQQKAIEKSVNQKLKYQGK